MKKSVFKAKHEKKLRALYEVLGLYFSGRVTASYVVPFLFQAAVTFWCTKDYSKEVDL